MLHSKYLTSQATKDRALRNWFGSRDGFHTTGAGLGAWAKNPAWIELLWRLMKGAVDYSLDPASSGGDEQAARTAALALTAPQTKCYTQLMASKGQLDRIRPMHPPHVRSASHV